MAIKIDVSFSNGRAIDKCGNIWMPTGSPTINNEKIKWNAESYKGIPGTNFHTDDPINFDIGTGDYTLPNQLYLPHKHIDLLWSVVNPPTYWLNCIMPAFWLLLNE